MPHLHKLVVFLLIIPIVLPACGEAEENVVVDSDANQPTEVQGLAGKPASVEAVSNETKTDIPRLINQVKVLAAKDKSLPQETLEGLVLRLETLDPSAEVDSDVLSSTRNFVAGEMRPGVFAAYLKTVLKKPWQQRLAWLLAKTKAGDGWACFYLYQCHLNRLVGTTHVAPLSSLPAPNSAGVYREACKSILAAKGFATNWEKVGSVIVLGIDLGHAPTIIAGSYRFQNAPILTEPLSPEDRAGFKRRIKEALASEHPMAMAAYGYELMYAPGIKPDYVEGLKFIRKAYDGGSGWAATLLGYAYRHGKGVGKDLEKAAEYFFEGMKRGHANSFAELGTMFDNGEGVKKDREKALTFYREAADMGNGFARQQLGWAYFKGNGVKEDKVAAATWWMLGARASDTESLRLAAWTMAHGVGTKANFSEARRVFYPLHYKFKSTAAGMKSWAQRYRNAKWVTSSEITSLVKTARIKVNVKPAVLKYYRKADLEAAVIAGARSRGLAIDPKATAVLQVDINGDLKQDYAFNRATIFFRLFVPGTIWRKNEHRTVDMIVHCNQQVQQLPRVLWRGVNDKLFHNLVRKAISDGLKGSSKSVALKDDQRTQAQAKIADYVLYIDYHASKATLKLTAKWAMLDLPPMYEPQVRYGGDRNLVDIHALQRYWKQQLVKAGAPFDPRSTTKVDHLIVAVSNSLNRNAKQVASNITVNEGDVLYEFDGKFYRYQGWLFSSAVSGIQNGGVSLYKAIVDHATQVAPAIAGAAKKN